MAKTKDIAEIAEKQRHLALLERVNAKDTLTKAETRDLRYLERKYSPVLTGRKQGQKRPGRDSKSGQFLKGQSGNPAGRPPGSSFMEEFKAALAETETAAGRTLLSHLVETAFEDNAVLIATVSKMLPTMRQLELSGHIESTKPSQEDCQAMIDNAKARQYCLKCGDKIYGNYQGKIDGKSDGNGQG